MSRVLLPLLRPPGKIPFGYRLSEDPRYLAPVPAELDALEEAKKYLDSCSLREIALWLQKKTGRRVSPQWLADLRHRLAAEKREAEKQGKARHRRSTQTEASEAIGA